MYKIYDENKKLIQKTEDKKLAETYKNSGYIVKEKGARLKKFDDGANTLAFILEIFNDIFEFLDIFI